MANDDHRTAHERSEGSRGEFSKAFRKSLLEHDVSQIDLAIVSGTDASIVQRWADPARREMVPLAKLPLFRFAERGAAVAFDLLEMAARELGYELRQRAPEPIADESTQAQRDRTEATTRELHEAVQAWLFVRLRKARSAQDIAKALKEMREGKRELDAGIALLEREYAEATSCARVNGAGRSER